MNFSSKVFEPDKSPVSVERWSLAKQHFYITEFSRRLNVKILLVMVGNILLYSITNFRLYSAMDYSVGAKNHCRSTIGDLALKSIPAVCLFLKLPS